MRVTLDRSMCVGHAQCSAICPSVFANDALGYATLLADGAVPAGDEAAAREAVASCPEQAIAVSES